ncbi:MAG: hypothetical protein KDA49_18830 [Rhodospirillaceae bacterium]|nr:hypothetical protein [Rhodospirillaceae bacterium]
MRDAPILGDHVDVVAKLYLTAGNPRVLPDLEVVLVLYAQQHGLAAPGEDALAALAALSDEDLEARLAEFSFADRLLPMLLRPALDLVANGWSDDRAETARQAGIAYGNWFKAGQAEPAEPQAELWWDR